MTRTKTLRRAFALAVSLAGTTAFVAAVMACGGSDDDDGSSSKAKTASTAFVPGSAAPMPPTAPGAGPHGPNPNGDGEDPDPDPTPVEAGTDAAKPDAPADATGQ